MTLVTVVTATWGRPRTILEHCVRSVAAQDYPHIEHLVVTDGPDESTVRALLARGYSATGRRRVVSLGRNWSQVYGDGGHGWTARQAGCWLAAGEWIAYLDDDDDWEPGHLSSVMTLAARSGASLVLSAIGDIRDPFPAVQRCGTPGMVHRADLLRLSGWQPDGYEADGRLAARWHAAGAQWAAHRDPTVRFNGHRKGVPD